MRAGATSRGAGSGPAVDLVLEALAPMARVRLGPPVDLAQDDDAHEHQRGGHPGHDAETRDPRPAGGGRRRIHASSATPGESSGASAVGPGRRRARKRGRLTDTDGGETPAGEVAGTSTTSTPGGAAKRG